MGQLNSSIVESVEVEYKKAMKKDSKRDYLTIDEAKRLKFPLEEYNVNFTRIAVLYVLDHDKNGKFSLEDLKEFAKFCSRIPSSSGFAQELEAQCTICMWKQATSENGRKYFVDWFVRVFTSNMKVSIKGYDHTFVNSDIVSTMHELLQFKEYFELTPQNLTTMMQSVGVELGLIDPDDESLMNVVPLESIRIFADNFVNGFFQMMTDIGFIGEVYSPSNQANDGEKEVSEDSDVNSEEENAIQEEVVERLRNKVVINVDNIEQSPPKIEIPQEEEERVERMIPMKLAVPAFRKKQFEDMLEDQGIATPELRSPKFGQKMPLGVKLSFSKLSIAKLEKMSNEK
jgi:hypothetical protein